MKRILFCLLAVLLLAGCSAKESPDIETTLDPEWAWLMEEPSGPEATEAVLELTAESLEESLEFYLLMNGNQSDAAYLDHIAQARNFSVNSFSQTGEDVSAEVTVTVPDLYTIVTSLDLSAYQTAEETDAALCNAIDEAAPQQKQVTLRFIQGGNRWEPVMDEEVTDVFYGGLMAYLKQTMEGVD